MVQAATTDHLSVATMTADNWDPWSPLVSYVGSRRVITVNRFFPSGEQKAKLVD
jgi:hypothetical protein